MSFELTRLSRGILNGAIVGFLHTIFADGIIATLMSGRFFYHYGGNLLFTVISETSQNIILGAILGTIGAYIAIETK